MLNDDPNQPVNDPASGAFGSDADAQQRKIRAVRDEQWRRALLAGPGADDGSAADDKPDIVDGNIHNDWKWHDETNALLRAAIESANDAIIITEADLDPPAPRIEYVNPAFTAMTGYTLDEILGKTPRILQGPRTDQGLLRRLRDDLINGRVFHGETINYRKDGSEYVVEWRITAMRDPSGRVLKWVAVQRDVTERRQEELRRDRQLADERAAREEAERVGRMKDEFLATLSHELRTPLNAILGWTQLLQRGRLTGDDVRRAIDTVERNARTQAQLIEDLLDMSRIMSGNIRLEMKPVPVGPIIEAAVQSLRPAAEAKDLRLTIEACGDGFGPIVGDAARVQQIAWNLLSNAIKFTPAGGAIVVGCGTQDGNVELTFTDTGIGIEPAFLPFVFDRFRQADASTTRSHGGLGLGLSIVKHLAELHGGTVAAHSDGPGCGSRFIVRFPLADANRPAEPGSDVPAGPPGMFEVNGQVSLAGVRVALVEDEEDARAFVARALEDAGAIVEDFASANALLARLDEKAAPPLDLLVSDISMPDVDGYELIRRLRRRAPDAGGTLPAIALTAFARAEDRRRALMAGYQSHLAKPIEAGDLAVEIRSLLGR